MPSLTLKCPQCGIAKLEPGKLVGWGLAFRPDNIKFLTLEGGLQVRAAACADCGNVQLIVDPAQLANMTK